MYAKKQEGSHKERTTATTGTESLCQQMEADMKKHATKSESEGWSALFWLDPVLELEFGSWSWGLMAAG